VISDKLLLIDTKGTKRAIRQTAFDNYKRDKTRNKMEAKTTEKGQQRQIGTEFVSGKKLQNLSVSKQTHFILQRYEYALPTSIVAL